MSEFMSRPHAVGLGMCERSHTHEPQLVFGLGRGKVGMQETSSASEASPTVDAISKVIQAAHDKEYASYTKYGQYAEVKEGLQAATMWNYIYTPAEYGPFMPVSRQWDFVRPTSQMFAGVAF